MFSILNIYLQTSPDLQSTPAMLPFLQSLDPLPKARKVGVRCTQLHLHLQWTGVVLGEFFVPEISRNPGLQKSRAKQTWNSWFPLAVSENGVSVLIIQLLFQYKYFIQGWHMICISIQYFIQLYVYIIIILYIPSSYGNFNTTDDSPTGQKRLFVPFGQATGVYLSQQVDSWTIRFDWLTKLPLVAYYKNYSR